MQISDSLFNSLFLKACRREPTERTPIWLMRQAGRYMKEYQEIRSKTGFLELCKNPDLAAEVTVFAAHRLGVDAAIIFSDLLLILEPMGFSLSYGLDQGPVISNPFRQKSDLKRLQEPDVLHSMGFVFEAIKKTRRNLKPDLPLIGFAGATFTMASYAIEGGGSKDFLKTKSLMTADEPTWHAFLSKIAAATIEYLNCQIEAGVQSVQIFDSWAGALSPMEYERVALPHLKRLMEGIRADIPVIIFGTKTAPLLLFFKKAGGRVIGIDSDINLDQAWSVLGDVSIMGNLNPRTLLTNPEHIISEAAKILIQAGGKPGHIFNLGHGVLKETPVDHVICLVDFVKEYSLKSLSQR